jgi:acetate kinase
MNGVDVIVFTAVSGENQIGMRWETAAARLLGVKMDKERNTVGERNNILSATTRK